ncbi:hypothetical protein D3C84_733430 [compost metagenome]
MVDPGAEQRASPVYVEPEPHRFGTGRHLLLASELDQEPTHITLTGLHQVVPGIVHQFEAVAVERGVPKGAHGLAAHVFIHPAQAGGIVNLPGAGVYHCLACLGGAVVLHQHGFHQGVAGLAVRGIGSELGLLALVHNHSHQILGGVDEVHGVEGEIADRGVHHDGIGHRVVIDTPALVDNLAIDNLLRQRQAAGGIDGGIRVEVRNVGQHELVEHDGGLVDEALLPIAGEGVGDDLAHGVPLSEAAYTSWFMSIRAWCNAALTG